MNDTFPTLIAVSKSIRGATSCTSTSCNTSRGTAAAQRQEDVGREWGMGRKELVAAMMMGGGSGQRYERRRAHPTPTYTAMACVHEGKFSPKLMPEARTTPGVWMVSGPDVSWDTILGWRR
eukprot:221433-Rhodomonas_salina.2